MSQYVKDWHGIVYLITFIPQFLACAVGVGYGMHYFVSALCKVEPLKPKIWQIAVVLIFAFVPIVFSITVGDFTL